MQPDEADAARLWDMLIRAREIVQTLGEGSFSDYLRDENLRLATERRLEIIGEAARNISDEFQAAHPGIPRRKITALRHILAHEYGEVKQDTVFRIATVHIPELVAMLEPLVPPAGTEG